MLAVATITNSTISGNFGDDVGGGIFNWGNMYLENSTISENSANHYGGGIFNWGFLLLVNSTISGNSVILPPINSRDNIYSYCKRDRPCSPYYDGNRGGGIYNDVGIYRDKIDKRYLILINSIISGNSPFNLVGNEGINRSSLIGDDPKLGELADNGGSTLTHALLLGSLAIDAGDMEFCPETDQRGIPRPQGAGCDIGSFELVSVQ